MLPSQPTARVAAHSLNSSMSRYFRSCQLSFCSASKAPIMHSAELFNDHGIKPSEVALLKPKGSEGTVVELASEKEDVRMLLEGGMNMGDAVLPLTAPAQINKLDLYK